MRLTTYWELIDTKGEVFKYKGDMVGNVVVDTIMIALEPLSDEEYERIGDSYEILINTAIENILNGD